MAGLTGLRRAQWARHPGAEAWVRGAAAAALAGVMRPAFAALAAIWRGGFQPDAIAATVDASLATIGLGMLLTAALV